MPLSLSSPIGFNLSPTLVKSNDCPTPENYSLRDLELMTYSELDRIIEGYYDRVDADFVSEIEKKTVSRIRKLSDEPSVSKVARRSNRTDVALERRRYEVLTESDAKQTDSSKFERAVTQSEEIKDPLIFNVESLVSLLPKKEKEKFELQFKYVKKAGKCGIDGFEDYMQKILKHCDSQRECLRVIDKKQKIYSSLLPADLARNEGRKSRVEVWLQLDEKNQVVGLYRPSVRLDHCKSLLKKIITPLHQIQPQLQQIA